mmetsp:Transcript_60679/g.67901  ORF Transcript_60679/g.67901 Transcript_60679/m.67901 type:complete len:163 (-) Transcript_60679:267-755(-)
MAGDQKWEATTITSRNKISRTTERTKSGTNKIIHTYCVIRYDMICYVQSMYGTRYIVRSEDKIIDVYIYIYISASSFIVHRRSFVVGIGTERSNEKKRVINDNNNHKMTTIENENRTNNIRYFVSNRLRFIFFLCVLDFNFEATHTHIHKLSRIRLVTRFTT